MPATSAYLYLMDSALSGNDFNSTYDLVIDNYKLIALDKAQDKKLTAVGLQRRMPKGWSVLHNAWWQRYFNDTVSEIDGGIDPSSIIMIDGKTIGDTFNVNNKGDDSILTSTNPKHNEIKNNFIKYSKSGKAKGMSTFDFDETLIIGGKNFVIATKGDDTVKISSEQWPIKGPELSAEGYSTKNEKSN